MPDTSSAMPPVPCPDCMHPTTFDEDAFVCSNCQQAFAHPHGMVLSQWRELWRAWTAGCAVVQLPEPDGRTYGGSSRWDASARRIIAKVDKQGRPYVRVDERIWLDGEAESVGLALVAAAREARRLASGSGVGDQPHPDTTTTLTEETS